MSASSSTGWARWSRMRGRAYRGDALDLPLLVVHHAARLGRVDPADVLSRSRVTEVCRARWVAMLALSREGCTQTQIGQILHRDASSVSHGLAVSYGDPQLVELARRVQQLARKGTA